MNLPKCFANNSSNTKALDITSYIKAFTVIKVSRIKTQMSHLAPSGEFYFLNINLSVTLITSLLFSEDRVPHSEWGWAILSQESFFTPTGLLTSLDVAHLDKRPVTYPALSQTSLLPVESWSDAQIQVLRVLLWNIFFYFSYSDNFPFLGILTRLAANWVGFLFPLFGPIIYTNDCVADERFYYSSYWLRLFAKKKVYSDDVLHMVMHWSSLSTSSTYMT